MNRPVAQFLTPLALIFALASPAVAQSFESVGERAIGMAGAFVAVANDSSATWWNPAGLATGPFLDVALGGHTATADGRIPASRTRVWSLAVGTPPLGVSYYRFEITDIRAAAPTAESEADRED